MLGPSRTALQVSSCVDSVNRITFHGVCRLQGAVYAICLFRLLPSTRRILLASH